MLRACAQLTETLDRPRVAAFRVEEGDTHGAGSKVEDAIVELACIANACTFYNFNLGRSFIGWEHVTVD